MTHPVYSAKPAHTTREQRARQIVRQHAREIAESAAGAIYKVPDYSGAPRYVVSLSRQTCECKDFEHRTQPCEHLIAAEIVSAKSCTCADCNNRSLGRDLIEVEEWHENLTWFVGDQLCRTCALGHGVL